MQKVWDIVKKYSKRYFIDAMSFMALGLFASLLIGTIIKSLADIPFLNFLKEVNDKGFSIVNIIMNSITSGAAIGVAIAYGLKKDPLVIFSSAATGAVGSYFGGPVGAYLGSLFGMEIGGLVSKKTPIDIVITPLCVVLIGTIVGKYLGIPVDWLMQKLGEFVKIAMDYQPIISAIIISVVVGCILTAPLSSAALCAMIHISGLAGGAATIGCCCQMVGFAVQSYKDNKWSGVLSVGIGTSMLQFSNCLKKPIVWLPTIIASAIIAPFGVCLAHITNDTAVLCGMGTCGLTGLFGAYDSMTALGSSWWYALLMIILFCVVLPAVITGLIDFGFRKLGWIKTGDLIINTGETPNNKKEDLEEDLD